MILKKIIAVIIIILILTISMMPTVNGIANELKNEVLDNSNLIEENDNFNNEESISDTESADVNSFNVLLASILQKNKELYIEDISSMLEEKPTKQGIWIEENSRDYLTNLLNSYSNDNYGMDKDGYLIIESQKEESEQNTEFELYTNEIKELINEDITIIMSIDQEYKELNEIDNEIVSIIIEDNKYVLLFKDNEDVEENEVDILILNSALYNDNNKDDALIDELLRVYDNDFSLTEKYQEDEIIENEVDKIDKTGEIEDIETSNDFNILERINILDDSVSEEDFNLVLAGILNGTEIRNIGNLEINNEISGTGIWINPSISEIFLEFLNKHTAYTYSINTENFLVCDNILKYNDYLEQLEGFEEETAVDIEINNILLQDILIMIDINNEYLQYEEGNIVVRNLDEEQFILSFFNNSRRIVFLNSNFYMNADYDLALSDYFTKSLQNIPSKVLSGELIISKEKIDNDELISSGLGKTEMSKSSQNNGIMRSSRSIVGYSTQNQTVYAGPDSDSYAIVGSIGNNEHVYVLGKSSGWYHIQYIVTGTNNGNGVPYEKSGFVPISKITGITGGTVHEEQMTGGYAYPSLGLSVRTCDDFDISQSVGSVFAGEGITVLYAYGYTDWNKSYYVAYIEYSTSTGTKRGYVYNDQLTYPNYSTGVARVTATSSAYSGPDGSYVKLGGVYHNEYVAVLERKEDWAFVEYNTSTGRKRGFMALVNMEILTSSNYQSFKEHINLKKSTQSQTVYGGPNSNYANIGSIGNQEVVSYINIENGYAYIEYTTGTGAKRGYVSNLLLVDAPAFTLPTVNTYNNFTKYTYGVSGLGTDLSYYKLGNGPNVVFAIFEQHGWEDAWAADGIELVKLADSIMSNLSSTNQTIFTEWTIYIIPYANPDGITNGYTNGGPGRCTVKDGLDLNRCWPADFVAMYTSRNKTGGLPNTSIESFSLKNFIETHVRSGENILLDVHGWYNETYGDSNIARFFGEQFGFPHYTRYSQGFLITWAQAQGIKPCLIELPKPSSSSAIISNQYAEKFAESLKNMIISLNQPEGGIAVDEVVRVYSTGNVNVRSQPNTSSTIVASIPNNTILTRIKREVITANGYVWDKVILPDGTTIGYIATNFLVLHTVNNYSEYQIRAVQGYLRFNEIGNYTGRCEGEYNLETNDAITEFQRINNFTQNGIITPETWNKMGLNNTNTCKMYYQYGCNYFNYENPYGKQSVSIEYNSYHTGKPIETINFVLGNEDSQVRQSVIDTMNEENERHGTMTYDEYDVYFWDIQEAHTMSNLILAGGTILGSGQAVVSMHRYKQNHLLPDLPLNIDSMHNSWSATAEVRNNFVDLCKEAAKQIVQVDNLTMYFHSSEQQLVNLKARSDGNWYYALGSYWVGMNCEATRQDNGIISLKVYYTVQDYYDWDPTDTNKFLGLVSPFQLYLLNWAGEAHNFIQKGNTIIYTTAI